MSVDCGAAGNMIVATDESKPVAIRRWYHQLGAQLQDVLRWRATMPHHMDVDLAVLPVEYLHFLFQVRSPILTQHLI